MINLGALDTSCTCNDVTLTMIRWDTLKAERIYTTHYNRVQQENTGKYYWKSPDSNAYAPAIWNLEDEFGREHLNSWYIGPLEYLFTNFVSRSVFNLA